MRVTVCYLYLWQPLYEGVYVSSLSGLFDLLEADFSVVVSVCDVLCQAAVKQHRLLGNNANLRAQPVDVQLLGVIVIQHLLTKGNCN